MHRARLPVMGKSGGCQGQMRSQCSLILPASFISQCRLGGLVGYAVLYPSAAPEERRLDPARGAWSVFMQMAAEEWSRADSSTSPILHTKGHSTTDNQEAAPLFFLPRALLTVISTDKCGTRSNINISR